MLTKELELNSIEISIDRLFTLIKEIYYYSTKLKPIAVDEKFVKWTVMKNYDNEV